MQNFKKFTFEEPSGLKAAVIFKIYEAGNKAVTTEQIARDLGETYKYSDIEFGVLSRAVQEQIEVLRKEGIIKSADTTVAIRDGTKVVTGVTMTNSNKETAKDYYEKAAKSKIAGLNSKECNLLKTIMKVETEKSKPFSFSSDLTVDELAQLKDIYEPLYREGLISKPNWVEIKGLTYIGKNIIATPMAKAVLGNSKTKEYEATR